MKRILILCTSILLATVLGSSFFCNALAETKMTCVKVIEGGASLRSYPDGQKIGGVQQNAVLDVVDQDGSWLYVYYNGQYGWISKGRTEVVATEGINSVTRESGLGNNNQNGGTENKASQIINQLPYDMGVPSIGNVVFKENMMNMVIFWVQTQLKATDIWYQGDKWHVTGYLGEHTMSEIRSFMEYSGYPAHSGEVDQKVIDSLADFLGERIKPVLTGGFYDAMDSILLKDGYGTMPLIFSNLRDMVPRETNGARWVQTILKHLGYYTSKVDGMYGEGTEKAVNLYQRLHNFAERDCVYLGLARSMLEQYYFSGGSLAALP